MPAPLCASNGTGVTVTSPDGTAAAPLPNLPAVLEQLWEATQTCEQPALPGAASLAMLMDRGFAASKRSGTTHGSITLGGVVDLTGAGNVSQRWEAVEEQWEGPLRAQLRSFVFDELIPLSDEFNDEAQHVRLAMLSGYHLEDEIMNKVLPSAMFWSLFSLGFIAVYLIAHTSSSLLAFAGLAHVLISFPTTWFFYYVVFRLKYMGTLNFVSLFVIMGIGADDIFVFVVAWK